MARCRGVPPGTASLTLQKPAGIRRRLAEILAVHCVFPAQKCRAKARDISCLPHLEFRAYSKARRQRPSQQRQHAFRPRAIAGRLTRECGR